MTDCTFSRLFFRDSSSRSGRVMYINSYFRNGSTSFWTQAAPLREQGVSISRLTTIDCIRDLEARQGLFPLPPLEIGSYHGGTRGGEHRGQAVPIGILPPDRIPLICSILPDSGCPVHPPWNPLNGKAEMHHIAVLH